MPEARSKKVVKKPAVKSVVKKPTSRSKTVKKTAAKKESKSKVAAPKKSKTTPKKAVAGKTASKPKVTKKATRQAGARTTKKPVKTPASKGVEIVLPAKMSLRAKEKSLVWAVEFEKKMHRPAYALTMTFGALFILFGSYSGLHYSSNDSGYDCLDSRCGAQLIGTDDGPAGEAAPEPSPEVELIGEIPGEITQDELVLVDTMYTERVSAELRFPSSSGSLQTQQISVGNALNGRFRITIPGSDLAPNQYTLRVQLYDAQGENYGYTTLGSFSVPTQSEPLIERPEAAPDFPDLVTDPTDGEDFPDLIQLPEEDESPVNLIEIPADEPNEQQTGSVEDSAAETESSEEVDSELLTEVDDSVVVTESDTDIIEEPEQTINEIYIQVDSVVSSRAPVEIQSSVMQFMAVYLRRLQSTEEQLVGRISGREVTYYLNTRDFPNGSYELTVRSASAFDDTESNSVRVQIQNEIAQITPLDPETTPNIEERREVLEINQTIFSSADRESETITTSAESDLSDVGVETERGQGIQTTTIDGPIRKRALERLEADTSVLDDLFTRYAAAVQSGDPDMIREARGAIASYQRSVVEMALADEDDRFIADDLSDSLQDEIDQITAKVETFESLRRERSEGKVSKDTDGDGITDVDERVLFATDPLRADTDGDGFTDGAEIIRGFNPVDAASEAVIVYKSPKETVGILANENLEVVEVVPDIAIPAALENEPIVQATVRGLALPNSFVTLFIFSTPTVVTVRTEADGSFEYTFSKELEDGEHQVFVALTDNTGDIVAQSEPFTFVKQAEAFTAVDAEAVISEAQPIERASGASSFQTVLSMSILALGILLILLGVGLRSNRPELPINEAAA